MIEAAAGPEIRPRLLDRCSAHHAAGGHADHVMDAVGRVVPSVATIRSRFNRRRPPRRLARTHPRSLLGRRGQRCASTRSARRSPTLVGASDDASRGGTSPEDGATRPSWPTRICGYAGFRARADDGPHRGAAVADGGAVRRSPSWTCRRATAAGGLFRRGRLDGARAPRPAESGRHERPAGRRGDHGCSPAPPNGPRPPLRCSRHGTRRAWRCG